MHGTACPPLACGRRVGVAAGLPALGGPLPNPRFDLLADIDSHLDAALAYAALGWRVFPLHHMVDGKCSCASRACTSPGKHPRTARGVHDAVVDEDKIRAWWGKWPDANIGIATGHESGLIVIDVDPDHGGADSWETLRRAHDLPDCVMVGTGGGGHHAYFAWPVGDHWRITIGQGDRSSLAPGIDHRGDGGYVVAPPSNHHSGRAYFWDTVEDDVLPPLPESVARLIHREERGVEYSGDRPVALDRNPPWWALLRSAGMTPEEIDAVSVQLSDPVEPHAARMYAPGAGERIVDEILDGGRHDAAVRAAGLLRRGGVSDQTLACAIRAISRSRMRPPFGGGPNDKPDEEDREIALIVRSTKDWPPDRVRWPIPDPEGIAAVLDTIPIADATTDTHVQRALRNLSAAGWSVLETLLDGRGWKRKQIAQVKAISAWSRENEPPPPGDDDRGPDEADLVISHVKDAPTPKGAIMPAGWQIDPSGALCRVKIQRTEDGGEVAVPVRVANSPIWIMSRDLDMATDRYVMQLAWRDRQIGSWRTCATPRGTIAASRRLPDVAEYGVPVTSENARDLVRWFAAYEEVNAKSTPRRRTSSRIGWHEVGDKVAGFLYGAEWIGGVTTVHQCAEGGVAQIVAGMVPTGDRDTERRALSMAMRYPHVAATIGASMSAPLLRIVGSHGYVLSLSGTTGKGKTSALRMAAAIWGESDEHSSESVMQTWDATRVGVVVLASTFDGVPMMLDDTSRAKNPHDVGQALYDVPSGKARLKGAKTGGLQQTHGSRTVLISTGEAPVLSYSQQGGTRARVLELWGDVWGAESPELGETVDELQWMVNDNHGHTGRDWVTYLVQHRKQWPAWRERYRDSVREMRDKMCQGRSVQTTALLSRLAGYVAAIDAALRLAQHAGVIDCDIVQIEEAIDEVIYIASSEATDRDPPTEALQLVISDATSRRHELWSLTGSYDNPKRPWIGRWDINGSFVGIFQTHVTDLLERAGHSPVDGIFKSWIERGWIEQDAKGKKAAKVVRFAGQSARLMCFKLHEITKVLGYDPGADDDGQGVIR
jgi:hypothetical protein